MLKNLLLISAIFICYTHTIAQDSLLLNRPYKEDQIYLRLTYNLLQNKPQQLVQKGLSLGMHAGFFKDIPFNEKGNIALGIGLGYAFDKYQSNLWTDTFQLVEISDKNKFETHAVEIPVELRFRNSSPTEYKFWRLYIGVRTAYIFSSKSVLQLDNATTKNSPVSHLQKWQIGPQISLGYSTWNLYANWNLTKLFKDAPVNEGFNPNELSNIKIGLQFYIF